MPKATIPELRQRVWAYFEAHQRNLLWRPPSLKLRTDNTLDPYKMLVSEVMLQQTQVQRVIPKYQEFLQCFPDTHTLSQASLGEVLIVWSGLGYNRRAKYLHDTAKRLASTAQPWTFDKLVACKGIGPNTAAAVCVYSYNQPLVFIETNIRTVLIHHFFPGSTGVGDKDLLPLIAKALKGQDPRMFYWALMDYGSFLKTSEGNAARFSKHYAKQAKFSGSRRQLRGQAIKLLAAKDYQEDELFKALDDVRTSGVLIDLVNEGLIARRGFVYHLA